MKFSYFHFYYHFTLHYETRNESLNFRYESFYYRFYIRMYGNFVMTMEPNQTTPSQVLVFTYYRVSTNKQAERNTYESQKMAVEDFLSELGFSIKEEFKDLAYSGGNEDRPQFQEMLSRLDEVAGIAVFSRSRITRNFFFGHEFDKLLYESNKMLVIAETKEVVKWDALEDPEDLGLLNTMKDYVNAKQRKALRLAIKAGVERARRDGVIFGRPPTKIRWKQVRHFISLGMMKSQIIRNLGTTPNTFYNRLRAHYYELRRKGTSQAEIGVRYNLKPELMKKWELQNPTLENKPELEEQKEESNEDKEIDDLLKDLEIDEDEDEEKEE